MTSLLSLCRHFLLASMMLNPSEILSSELWARVFVHLSPNQWRSDSAGLAQEDVEQYPHLHKLQLVCRKFAGVFREHDALFGALLLRENLGIQAIPGLLAWLQRHNSDISFLQGLCSGPCADVALTSLIGTQKLKRVDLTLPTESAIQILSMCSSLVACTLRRPRPVLDLDSLQRLQKLVSLHLKDGSFSILDKSADYTNTHQCKSECQCCCKGQLWGATAFYEKEVY